MPLIISTTPSASGTQAASGEPWSATSIQSTGDPLADMHEDMAAEQKARLTYDNILRLVKDPDVCDPIRFLRERELVHYQRFGESLRLLQDDLNKKKLLCVQPGFRQTVLQIDFCIFLKGQFTYS